MIPNLLSQEILKTTYSEILTKTSTSFPGLQCEDEARHEEALVLGRSILHSDWLTPYCLKITELDS